MLYILHSKNFVIDNIDINVKIINCVKINEIPLEQNRRAANIIKGISANGGFLAFWTKTVSDS